MRFILTSLLILLTFASAQSQVMMDKDSLLKLLPSAKEDTTTVLLFINLGQQYESNDPEQAKQYYRRAGRLSEKIGYVLGEIKFITNYGFILNMQGHYDSSLVLNLKSVALSRAIKDSVYLAKTLFNTGTSYRALGEYEQAVAYYEEGKEIFQRFGNESIEAQINDILQVLYTDMHQYEKGIEYGKEAVSLSRKLKNDSWLGFALTNLGVNYIKLKQFNEATPLFEEALKISKRIGDKNMENGAYLNIGDILLEGGQHSKAKPYWEKANVLSEELGMMEGITISKRGLSFYYLFIKEYQTAMVYAKGALSLTYQYNLRVERLKILSHISNIEFARQNIQEGSYYATRAEQLSDSLMNETIQKNVLDLEKKYEAQKKQAQIKQLEASNTVKQLSIDKKNTLNYILIASALILLVISILSYRNFKHKQKFQQQRIIELETQQQLMATEAVLKGEEQERTRLAKDLHDGLGGMLSGIKYSLNTMKGNLIMTPDNAQAFERSIDMLDSSIKEMRRVAHNMMPEALVKFGLDAALNDFCNDLNHAGVLQVSYQSIGLREATLSQTTAITIYRIVQELLNNVMKHAAAEKVIVQVSKINNDISVTVEDDGKGFDPAILKGTKGMGWNNIQSRIAYLKGKLDVQSGSDKGTSVMIEFKNM